MLRHLGCLPSTARGQPARPPCPASWRRRSAASSSAAFGFAMRALARDGATRGASPSILRKCGGHGASPSPAASSRAASSSSASSEPRRSSIAGVRIADRGEALAASVSTVKSAGSQSGTSSQVERRRDARIGQRPHRIGRAGRAVLGVLVVVEKDAAALLLPPFRRRQRRRAPLDLARERQRGAPHLGERPALLDAHVDVHAARAAGLWPAAKAQLLEERLHLHRDAPHVVPLDARRRIEIDAQLVGMIEVVRRAPDADAARCSRDSRPTRGRPHRRRRPLPRCGRTGTTA